MLTRYIFLDVDGVLNDGKTEDVTPGGCVGVEDKYIERLAKIVKETKAKIVLSSDWRRLRDSDGVFYGDAKYLETRLEEHGLKIKDCLKGGGSFWRALEIMSFLDDHPCRSFVILDDKCLDFSRSKKLWQRLVMTGKKTGEGLSDADVEAAVKILKNDIQIAEW